MKRSDETRAYVYNLGLKPMEKGILYSLVYEALENPVESVIFSDNSCTEANIKYVKDLLNRIEKLEEVYCEKK